MTDIISTIYNNYFTIAKMTVFNYLKTDNPIYDAILSTVVLSFFGYIFNYLYDNCDNLMSYFSTTHMTEIFYKKHTLMLEGKQSSVISAYNSSHNVSSLYSDRFKAIWDYIIQHIEDTNSIHCIKESVTNYQSYNKRENREKYGNMFMVNQRRHFTIDKNIFIHVITNTENMQDDHEKISTKTDKITLHIYSYIYSLNYLKKYVDSITENYLATIKDNRQNKRFIYSLDKVTPIDDQEDSDLNCWREDIFESARTLDNIFFDGKSELIEKIDFFLENRDWYYEKGIPYSLGIGLHGPPGTGKTSFIKALANYTNRHIIVISLKLIKTKQQLEKFFFEHRYNDKNEHNGVSFDKKIIVFEDIDCIGDIILERSKNVDNGFKKQKTFHPADDVIKIGDVLQSIYEINDVGIKPNPSSVNTPITLDDILNLWDGIRETPGRIMIISSNHYDKLDQALIRPGRIDISHELSNASHNTISELYHHLFGTQIPKQSLKKIKEYYYSPAELINIYVSHKNKTDFLNRVLENRKV